MKITSMRLRIYFGGASPNCGAGVRPYLIRRPALAYKNPTCFSRGSMSSGLSELAENLKVLQAVMRRTKLVEIIPLDAPSECQYNCVGCEHLKGVVYYGNDNVEVECDLDEEDRQ